MRLVSSLNASSGSPEDTECPTYRNTLIGREFKFILTSRIGEKCSATAGQIALTCWPAQGENFIPTPGVTGLPVRSAWRPGWPIIFAETAKKMQNLKENMGAGTKLSSEDSQVVKAAADKANITQRDRYAEYYIKALLAGTP
jgi:hypothetical protein